MNNTYRARKILTHAVRVFAVVAMALSGCGKPPLIQESAAQPVVGQAPANTTVLKVLFIGNSHSAPLPRLLKRIFKRKHPSVTPLFDRAPFNGFLVDHAKNQDTLELIENGKWDYVILQAQKYSTSGKYTYSTDGALKLSELATAAGSKIIMFPEWPRKGIPEEYVRIKAIHNSIAEKTGASVAPIGEAWALALAVDDPHRPQLRSQHDRLTVPPKQ